MDKNTTDNNKKGILAPLLKTLDYLLATIRYKENSRVRKKLEPAILVVVIILLGFIVALFANLVNFEIKKFVGTFIGIPLLLVIGSWIISAFNIKEKTKKRLGVFFIIIAVLGFLVYILYENRQVIYNLKKEIDTEFKNKKDIDTTKKEKIVDKDTNSNLDKQDNPQIEKPIIDDKTIEYVQLTISMPPKKIKSITYGDNNDKVTFIENNEIQSVFEIPKGSHALIITYEDGSLKEISKTKYLKNKLL